MMLFCSRTFYSLLSSPMINVVTTPSDVTDVTVWPISSNPNPRVLKIENKRKLSPLSIILTLSPLQDFSSLYSMKYIYSTSQMSKLSLTLHTFSITGLVAGLFLINKLYVSIRKKRLYFILFYFLFLFLFQFTFYFGN